MNNLIIKSKQLSVLSSCHSYSTVEFFWWEALSMHWAGKHRGSPAAHRPGTSVQLSELHSHCFSSLSNSMKHVLQFLPILQISHLFVNFWRWDLSQDLTTKAISHMRACKSIWQIKTFSYKRLASWKTDLISIFTLFLLLQH